VCPNGTFYLELQADGSQLILGTYDTPELPTRTAAVTATRSAASSSPSAMSALCSSGASRSRGDVRNQEEFFAMKREERRADRRHRREFAEQELENSNSTPDFDRRSDVERSLDRDHLR
jgi:hypothetical protein